MRKVNIALLLLLVAIVLGGVFMTRPSPAPATPNPRPQPSVPNQRQIPARLSGILEMQGSYSFNLRETGDADATMTVDRRLVDLWGEETMRKHMTALLYAAKQIFGRVYLEKDTVVIWDRDQTTNMRQQCPFIGGATYFDQSSDKIIIALFTSQPTIETLAHEFAHANVRHLELPVGIDEGLATIYELVVTGLINRGSGSTANAVLLDLLAGRERTERASYVMMTSHRSPGLELEADGTISSWVPIAFYQYGLAANTLLRLQVQAARSSQPHQFIKSLLDWRAQHLQATYAETMAFIRERGGFSSEEPMEMFTLFAPKRPGLYALLVANSPPVAGKEALSAEGGVLCFYRERDGSLPAFNLCLHTSRGTEIARIPEGGAVLPFRDLHAQNETALRFWRQDRADQVVTIQLGR